MSEELKKRGRPPLLPGERKTAFFNTRLRGGLREKIAAAAKTNGRSLSGEIEHRLEQSFIHDAVGGLEGRVKALALVLDPTDDQDAHPGPVWNGQPEDYYAHLKRG